MSPPSMLLSLTLTTCKREIGLCVIEITRIYGMGKITRENFKLVITHIKNKLCLSDFDYCPNNYVV